MEQIKVQVPAEITSLKTLADRTIRLTVDVGRELSPEQSAVIFALRNLPGWFLFSPNPLSEEEAAIPEVAPEFKNDKSPSQRLRGVLYRVWEQNEKTQPFEEFYRVQMEKIIEYFKEKLNA